MYRRLAEVRSGEDVQEVLAELVDRYGEPPPPVGSLLQVARLRARLVSAGLTDVTRQGNFVRFAPADLPESAQLRLRRLYPKSIVKANLRTILVPRPSTAPVGGQPLRDEALLAWCHDVIDSVFDPAPVGSPQR
jgi:transcription-repair coupling factor (superfamily II helicase)